MCIFILWWMAEHFREGLYTTDGICRDMPGSRGRLKSRVNEIQCNPAKMYSLLLLRLRFAFRVRSIHKNCVRGDFITITSKRSIHIYIYAIYFKPISRAQHEFTMRNWLSRVYLRKHIEISIFNLFRCLYYII